MQALVVKATSITKIHNTLRYGTFSLQAVPLLAKEPMLFHAHSSSKGSVFVARLKM